MTSIKFSDYTEELQRVLSLVDQEAVHRAANLVQETWIAGRQVITCGNGGSASTASHFITDWAKMAFLSAGRPFRGICLNDNVGMVTAYANDLSYADIFSKAVENYAQSGDLLIVVSGSGKSPNVVHAIEAAHSRGAVTLAFCGYDGGVVRKLAHHAVWIPSFDMQICEDLHLLLGHFIMKILTDSPVKIGDAAQHIRRTGN